MRVLELFSGTGSVGKICKELGYEVVSLDLKGADINCNILEWDHTIYPVGHFDIIWASPPCDTFSILRKTWIGRKLKCHNGQVCTLELLQKDINEIGIPILRKAEAIIDYFKPNLWFIENPQTGRMKDYITRPYYDVDYCKYSNWGYKKPTRIWTNKVDFQAKTCNKDCCNMQGKYHKVQMGMSRYVQDGDNIIPIRHKQDREKYKDYPNINSKLFGSGQTKQERYRIPPLLISELLA